MKRTGNFAERLKAALRKSGMSQKKLANAICVSEAAISRYVSGEREPKVETFAKIAQTLAVSLDYLAGLQGNE